MKLGWLGSEGGRGRDKGKVEDRGVRMVLAYILGSNFSIPFSEYPLFDSQISVSNSASSINSLVKQSSSLSSRALGAFTPMLCSGRVEIPSGAGGPSRCVSSLTWEYDNSVTAKDQTVAID